MTGGPLPEGTDIEQVFATLEEREEHFAGLYFAAAEKGLRLRFTASLERTAPGVTASIRLQAVDQRHPSYHLRGTENAIIIRSALHPYPLVISGAGEGAGEAASSLLNDILK